MINIGKLSCVAIIVFFSSAAVLADQLASTATPMSSDAISKIYSGKTAVWKSSEMYFSPDGTVKGLYGKPKPTSPFSGTWSVNGNELCATVAFSDKPTTYTDCWKWWTDGKKLVTLWSKHNDNSAVDETHGYFKEIEFRRGDLVSK
jgi:hypothetical protein